MNYDFLSKKHILEDFSISQQNEIKLTNSTFGDYMFHLDPTLSLSMFKSAKNFLNTIDVQTPTEYYLIEIDYYFS